MLNFVTYEDNFVVFKATGLNFDDFHSEGLREEHALTLWRWNWTFK